ncbi:MAG: hypothetical protein WCD57_15110, partial [Acidobacteriaceae bacterium]
SELILIKCYFFLDTIFLGFYTFVNCKVSLAGSMSTRQRENRNNGNQESSSKEASEEGSQENCKEEVSRQRNRQHNRGTPKASPEVFLVKANSSVFMRLQRTLRRIGKFVEGARVAAAPAAISLDGNHAQRIPCSPFSRFRGWVRGGVSPRAQAKAWEASLAGGEHPGFLPEKAVPLLPKWYWVMPPLDEGVKR